MSSAYVIALTAMTTHSAYRFSIKVKDRLPPYDRKCYRFKEAARRAEVGYLGDLSEMEQPRRL